MSPISRAVVELRSSSHFTAFYTDLQPNLVNGGRYLRHTQKITLWETGTGKENNVSDDLEFEYLNRGFIKL